MAVLVVWQSIKERISSASDGPDLLYQNWGGAWPYSALQIILVWPSLSWIQAVVATGKDVQFEAFWGAERAIVVRARFSFSANSVNGAFTSSPALMLSLTNNLPCFGETSKLLQSSHNDATHLCGLPWDWIAGLLTAARRATKKAREKNRYKCTESRYRSPASWSRQVEVVLIWPSNEPFLLM